MERSEWSDDDAAGDASNDGSYPPAPLPEHERTWRHPSEIGNATWGHTEQPITIGRGLLLTTGAIGGLLSLAVLWAMLPSAGRGGDATPTAVTSTAKGLSSAGVNVRPFQRGDVLLGQFNDLLMRRRGPRLFDLLVTHGDCSSTQVPETCSCRAPGQDPAGRGAPKGAMIER